MAFFFLTGILILSSLCSAFFFDSATSFSCATICDADSSSGLISCCFLLITTCRVAWSSLRIFVAWSMCASRSSPSWETWSFLMASMFSVSFCACFSLFSVAVSLFLVFSSFRVHRVLFALLFRRLLGLILACAWRISANKWRWVFLRLVWRLWRV